MNFSVSQASMHLAKWNKTFLITQKKRYTVMFSMLINITMEVLNISFSIIFLTIRNVDDQDEDGITERVPQL